MELLSIYRLFYLLGAVNALFFSILIFSKKSRTQSDKILGTWLIVLFGQLIIPFLYLADLTIYYKYAGIECSFYALHPIFLYFYVKTMIGQKLSLKNVLSIGITALLAEIAALSFFLFPAEDRLNFIRGKFMLPAAYTPAVLFMLVYFSYYVYISYNTLKIYKVTALQVFSYRENVDLLWLRRLVVLFSSIVVVVFPTGLISYYYFHSLLFSDFFFFITLVVFIFFLGFWGYQQGQIFNFNNGVEMIADAKENYKTPVITVHHDEQYKKKARELKTYMEATKPFLNPQLTIHDLARELSLPPHLLSKIINKEFQTNFFEFVNNYRIEEFKKKAFSKDYKNLTILAVALDCGFNSKSAFNRIFKDYTGITPGDFIKHHHS